MLSDPNVDPHPGVNILKWKPSKSGSHHALAKILLGLSPTFGLFCDSSLQWVVHFPLNYPHCVFLGDVEGHFPEGMRQC